MDQAVTDYEKRPEPITADREPQLQVAGQDEQSDITEDIVPTTKLQFLVIFVALVLAIFCVALDNTIIVTAIPRITDTYKSLNDVGW